MSQGLNSGHQAWLEVPLPNLQFVAWTKKHNHTVSNIMPKYKTWEGLTFLHIDVIKITLEFPYSLVGAYKLAPDSFPPSLHPFLTAREQTQAFVHAE